jgi:hypothetical protein
MVASPHLDQEKVESEGARLFSACGPGTSFYGRRYELHPWYKLYVRPHELPLTFLLPEN